jgi:Rhs element Vgr protein
LAYVITLKSDGKETLLFRRMHGKERLGQLFSFRVEIFSQAATVNLRKLLGTMMTVKMEPEGGEYKRYFNGMVCAAEQTGYETIKDVRYATYAVTLVPKPWLLTRKINCRIFTKSSVPEIIKKVLSEIGYTDLDQNLSVAYPKRDYCVMYRESYFNFISRLMEQEGIYYYFTHTSNRHVMVLADSGGAHVAAVPFATIPYCPPTQTGKRNDASVSVWTTAQSVNSLKCELTDFDPKAPTATMLDTASLENDSGYHDIDDLTVFDFPGAYTKEEKSTTGQRYAQVQAQALNAEHLLHTGTSDAWGLATGNLFTLKDFPLSDLNQEYLVVDMDITLEGVEFASGAGNGVPFACSFQAIASKQPYRSPQITPKPVIAGLQTAIVTGSATDGDIVVDKNGRIQVTFHWNKPDKEYAQNSCMIRVASSWAGKGWGAIHIPRVGQEVVISFLEGDPDQPLVVGSVYNATHMPPYTLPDNSTQSGIKSRSVPNGTSSTYNEIRFDDKKGSEDFSLHAQKDMHEDVLNDHIMSIGHNETGTIKNNRTQTVEKDDQLTVNGKGYTKIAESFKLEAGTEIEFVTGASSITMNSSGEIKICGVNIVISGDASVKVQSDATAEVSGSAMTTVKGAVVSVKGEAMTQIAGGLITIG